MFVLENTRGIESRSVAASTTAVNYTFNPFRAAPFTGFLLVDLQQVIPTDAAATLPVTFGGVQVLNTHNQNATVTDFGGPGVGGIYLLYYNSRTGRLQLVGTYETTAAAGA